MLKSLYHLLTSDPLRPKILLCNSHAQGHQWLERMGAEYGPVLNVSVATMESAVLDLATLALEEAGLTYVSGESLTWLTHALLLDIVAPGNALLEESTLSPGFVRAFRDAISELRVAGVESFDLKESMFENTNKGRLVKQLLLAYESYMEQKHLADYSRAVEYAVKEPEQASTSASTPTPIYILLKSLKLDRVSERFIQRLAQVYRVEWFDDTVPEDAPLLPNVTTVQLFHTAGSMAEAREVFRRILALGAALDDIEIVAAAEEEAMAVYTASHQLGVPVCFQNGLPGHVAGLGQLAYVFLDWVESGYHVSHLTGAMHQGVLRIPSKAWSTSQFVRALEEAKIGWGRERYLSVLQRRWAEGSSEDADGLEIYRELYQHFSDLFSQLCDRAVLSVSQFLSALDFFLTCFGRVKDERDGQVLARIREVKESFRGIPSFQLNQRQVLQYARQLVDSIRVDAYSRPEPGAVYVSDLDSGGQTGRTHTFVMGCSEKNWGLKAMQDPILLDEERAAIHPLLRTSEQRLKEYLADRRRWLHRLCGYVTFSYSAFDLKESTSEPPAPELLTVYREHGARADADYTDLARALGEPIGYAGRVSSAGTFVVPLDEADLWISRAMAPTGLFRDGLSALLHNYPWLLRGSHAEARRASNELTEFDGLVDVRPGVIQKAYHAPTALETLARCPRKYLFRHVLNVRPSEAVQFRRSEWLSAGERGSLYHQIFRMYIHEIANGAAPDEARLMTICEEVLARYRDEVPGPSRHVVELECNHIRQSMRKFFRMEQARHSTPLLVEQEIGQEDAPVAVDLGNGVILPIYGKVDRVDKMGPHVYRVMDYKTGSDWKYSQNAYFKSGQQLQHALYAIAVEQWLQASGRDPEAQVLESGYVFPTLFARREEVVHRQDKRDEVRRLVSHMLSVRENGVFLATKDAEECKRCEFLRICTKRAAGQSKEKRNNPDNAGHLADLLEVENFA
ncbi:hypothetical protein GCM10025857_07560 [Alicyclobacillus contaminans]|nr:hypothetical protein GCM10025857_07560 [Alicyclobacillus contaminans]